MERAHRVRGRGRPTRPVLTRAAIVEVGLALAAEGGTEPLSIAGIAKRLGVSTSALYNHADGKATVLSWMLERINSQIDTGAFARAPWREAMEEWARSYWQAYTPYPALASVMAVQPVADLPVTLRMYETVLSSLLDAGWPDDRAVDLIVAVESLVFGAVIDTVAPPDIFEPGALADLAPQFTAATRRRLARHGDAAAASRSSFDMALAALLASVEPHRD